MTTYLLILLLHIIRNNKYIENVRVIADGDRRIRVIRRG